MFVPLQGYMPDSDPCTPGAILDCNSLLPSMRGYKAAPTAVSTSLTLAAACRGGAALRQLDGTTRLMAGSALRLYEASGGAWLDRTVDTAGYGLTGESRWCFAQFGSTALVSAKTEKIQANASTVFSRISTAPKASIIETVENFVMAFDTDETVYGSSPNRWWCSAVRDHTDWTPSVSTQCATNTLVSTPGGIRAGKRFGENIIAYKLRSMYRGVYVGQPTIWDWPVIRGDIGALSNESVVDVGTAEFPCHAFMGENDFYLFDGSAPHSIGTNSVRDKVFNELNRARQGCVIGQLDSANTLVRWYYPTIDSVNPNRCVVWNYRTNKWGRDDRQVEAVIPYIEGGITYDQLGTSYATYQNLPDVPYDSAFATADAIRTGIFNTSHVLQTLTGTATGASLTTGDIGNDDIFTLVDRIRPRFLVSPSGGSLTNYYRNDLGSASTIDSGAALSNGKFDFQREAKWHRFAMQFNGEVELTGLNISMGPGGDE